MTGFLRAPNLRHLGLRLAVLAGLLALLGLGTGCATTNVRAYQRERLTDRIMSFQADAKGTARRMKTFESREGSTGGSAGAGGGCACN
jgi:uncharacterized protein DUF4266